jgi:predicted nuclease of predicted toxin-antitoxin system
VSLLFDQNLSWRLVGLLAVEYPGSEQVIAAGLAGADDRTVWSYAATKGLAIVSKDADFRDLSTGLGAPPKVIWVRVGNGPTRDIEDLLRARLTDVTAFLADPSAALLELP